MTPPPLNSPDVLARIEDLTRPSNPAVNFDDLLDAVLAHFQCSVGTIHRLVRETQDLALVAHRGVPPPLLERVRLIPMGKGMAGLAALRREPVSVCNLQTDDSGAAKPAARQAGAEGSLTVPMLVDGDLRGTLGIALTHAHDFTNAEKSLLLRLATLIGTRLG